MCTNRSWQTLIAIRVRWLLRRVLRPSHSFRKQHVREELPIAVVFRSISTDLSPFSSHCSLSTHGSIIEDHPGHQPDIYQSLRSRQRCFRFRQRHPRFRYCTVRRVRSSRYRWFSSWSTPGICKPKLVHRSDGRSHRNAACYVFHNERRVQKPISFLSFHAFHFSILR